MSTLAIPESCTWLQVELLAEKLAFCAFPDIDSLPEMLCIEDNVVYTEM